jgi:hypothetical protein
LLDEWQVEADVARQRCLDLQPDGVVGVFQAPLPVGVGGA